MLTSRLPQSTCSFASTHRPSSATASTSMPSAVEVPPLSAEPTAGHLFRGGKGRQPPSVNCASVHPDAQPSLSSSSSLTTFQPMRDAGSPSERPSSDQVPTSTSSPACCGDCLRSSTSATSFPPPPPPLPPSFIALSCSVPLSQPTLTVVVGHHVPCVDERALQTNAPVPPPPPPPPPATVPCPVPPPPPPLLPVGQRHGLPEAPKSAAVACGRTPRTKLRRLQWHKIPDTRVRALGGDCVWAQVQRRLKRDSAAPCPVDLERVEQLFAVSSSSSGGGHGLSRPKSGPAASTLDRRKSDQV